jgi:hypothetical protein
MFAIPFLTVFLSSIRFTQSAVVISLATADSYNCGCVRTRWNSSVVAEIFALEVCVPFYYNETICNYQDAFSYTLYRGRACRFHSYVLASYHMMYC